MNSDLDPEERKTAQAAMAEKREAFKKAADTNQDGTVDAAERAAVGDKLRKKFKGDGLRPRRGVENSAAPAQS